MFFVSFKYKKVTTIITLGLVICLFVLISNLVSACKDLSKNADTYEERCDIAALYGYDITKAEQESAYIDLSLLSPEYFRSYNELQNICGFDISDYSDKTIIRYSYIIDDGKREVGILTYNGKLIGGDVFLFEEGKYLSLSYKNGE